MSTPKDKAAELHALLLAGEDPADALLYVYGDSKPYTDLEVLEIVKALRHTPA